MLTKDEILNKFNTLKEYEKFSNDWMRSCARINNRSRNAEMLKADKKKNRAA